MSTRFFKNIVHFAQTFFNLAQQIVAIASSFRTRIEMNTARIANAFDLLLRLSTLKENHHHILLFVLASLRIGDKTFDLNIFHKQIAASRAPQNALKSVQFFAHNNASNKTKLARCAMLIISSWSSKCIT